MTFNTQTRLPKCQQARWEMPNVFGFQPSQVWKFKQIFGDVADNLQPGCHPGMIDLFRPLVDPLEQGFVPKNLLSIKTSQSFDERRAQQFGRILPDLPFNPIRIGVS